MPTAAFCGSNALAQPIMPNKTPIAQDIRKVYRSLFKYFGPQHWWPGETTFEVIVGAVLTQNTNWGNVEKAISNLKREGLLSLEEMHRVSTARLANAIKPAGYFNVKAKRLKNVTGFIMNEYGGSLDAMKAVAADDLRRQWLLVSGVGPETADSILLYAIGKPVFVIDAYTKRFLVRHNMVPQEANYGQVQSVFLEALDRDGRLFNEYHALIVKLGKEHCRPKPNCGGCPLRAIRYDIQQRCGHCFRAFVKEEKDAFAGKEQKLLLCRECQRVN